MHPLLLWQLNCNFNDTLPPVSPQNSLWIWHTMPMHVNLCTISATKFVERISVLKESLTGIFNAIYEECVIQNEGKKIKATSNLSQSKLLSSSSSSTSWLLLVSYVQPWRAMSWFGSNFCCCDTSNGFSHVSLKM